MKKSVIFASIFAVIAFGASAHAAQFVTNGNFTALTHGVGQLGEDTNAIGWSSAGSNGSYNFVMTNATAGANGQYGNVALWDHANGGVSSWNGLSPITGNFVALNGDFHTGPITQTITGLTRGKTYDLTFDYAFSQQAGVSGNTVQMLAASFGGANIFTSPVDDLASRGFSEWKTYTGTVTATGSSEILSFLAHGSPQLPAMALLTDVSLTSPAVPEPATWCMMLVGFGAIGIAARRRRQGFAFA